MGVKDRRLGYVGGGSFLFALLCFALFLSFGAYTFFWPFTYISVVMLVTEIDSLSPTVPIWSLLTSKEVHSADH